jgi:hypothetical protein
LCHRKSALSFQLSAPSFAFSGPEYAVSVAFRKTRPTFSTMELPAA